VDEATQPDPPGDAEQLEQPDQPDQPDQPLELEPSLDPDVEAQVRSLPASLPAPTMPSGVEDRILLALAAERAAGGGHRASGGAARVPAVPHRAGQADHDVLTPLIRQRQRPRPLLAAAAVAAAAAVVAVGGSALHLNKRPSGSAAAIVASSPTAVTSATEPGASTRPATGGPTVHIQLSRTAYDASTIAAQARRLLASPATPLREGAAESPSLGPIATEIGLASCLAALGEREPDFVAADLATYAGEPAAIIVVTNAGTSTAYAVRRHCTTGDAQVLLGATPVP
jgi:hypothetical protein